MSTAALERIEINEGDVCEWCACGDPAVAVMIGTRLRICDWAGRSTIKLAPKRKPESRPGFIYVIQAGRGGPVKIGWSINPFGRLEGFQTAHYEELRIVREFPGTVPEERALHKKFRRYQIRNEWFSPRVLKLLDEVFPGESSRRAAW